MWFKREKLPLSIFQQRSNANNLKKFTMNRRAAVVFFVFFIPVAYALYIASSLIALIFEDGLRDSVGLSTVEARENRSDVTHPIPKIIHQTWKNKNVPEQWQIAQFTWYLSHSLSRSSLMCPLVSTCTQTIIIWYVSPPICRSSYSHTAVDR